jgi:hypothetical protein
MEISPNGGGGYDVLPSREWFATLSEAEHYVRIHDMSLSPTARWAAHSLDNILAPGAQVIDGLTTAARLAQVAAAEIEATAPGDLVPGTALTREAADELMALAAHVLAFVNAPISEGGPTPSEVISRFK